MGCSRTFRAWRRARAVARILTPAICQAPAELPADGKLRLANDGDLLQLSRRDVLLGDLRSVPAGGFHRLVCGDAASAIDPPSGAGDGDPGSRQELDRAICCAVLQVPK